jgi:hypothetical protein
MVTGCHKFRVEELYYWVTSPDCYYSVGLPDVEFNTRVPEPSHLIGLLAP